MQTFTHLSPLLCPQALNVQHHHWEESTEHVQGLVSLGQFEGKAFTLRWSALCEKSDNIQRLQIKDSTDSA